jgi:hypothetical protein
MHHAFQTANLEGYLPLHSTIDKKLRLVIGTAWGCVTFPEIKAHQDKMLSDPDFNPEFNQLMDASKVTDWRLTIEEAETAARRKIFAPSSKRAIVGPLPVNSPLARIIGALNELTKHTSNLEVFQDVPSALKWLRIEALPVIKSGTEEP